jgi:hypothetical protein
MHGADSRAASLPTQLAHGGEHSAQPLRYSKVVDVAGRKHQRHSTWRWRAIIERNNGDNLRQSADGDARAPYEHLFNPKRRQIGSTWIL